MRSKFVDERRIFRARFCVAFEDGVDLCVGHPCSGANDAFDNLIALDAAVGVKLHQATQYEAVFIRLQAANAGGKLLGQHGDGAVGEVDAGAAQARFEVEIGACANIL